MIAKNILVLGAGFIGQAVISKLIFSGHNIIVIDRHPCRAEFIGQVRWICSDYRSEANFSEILASVDIVYYFISTSVPGDVTNCIMTELHENIMDANRFIECCIKAKVKRIVFSSSSSVYGVHSILPIREDYATNPISVHGLHKLIIEKILLLNAYKHDIDVRILRIANPYGPSQNIEGRQGFIAMSIGKIRNNLPVILRGGGLIVRDFIYIDDAAEAIARSGLMDNLPSIINIGSGVGLPLKYVLDALGGLLNIEINTIDVADRVEDIPQSILSADLMKEKLLYAPNTSLHDGLVKVLSHHSMFKS